MNTYLEDYLTMLRVEKSLSKKSIDAYRNDLTRYLEFLTENQLLNNLTEIRQIHIREYIRFISDLEFQPTTIRRNFSSIQSYHKFLSSEKLLSTNPSQIIDPPKLPKRIPETLSVTEIDAIINVVNLKDPMGYRDKAILEVLYSAGLRVTELCDLLLPRKILPDKPFLKVYGKKDKERLVPIGQKAIDSINIYKRKIRYKQVERFKKKEKEIQHLFLSKNCWRLTRMTVNNIVKKWSQAAGITKKVYPHIFRHSFATHLIDGGANIIQIQMMLGHADVSTTQIYTHHDTLFKTSQLEQFHPRW